MNIQMSKNSILKSLFMRKNTIALKIALPSVKNYSKKANRQLQVTDLIFDPI